MKTADLNDWMTWTTWSADYCAKVCPICFALVPENSEAINGHLDWHATLVRVSTQPVYLTAPATYPSPAAFPGSTFTVTVNDG